ncbi:MAG: hypothetical protein KDI31_09095, partial [Pseudomonadales bacterium]|nr:hypothetical protein [Pseudomonadales bacterium]
AGLPLRDGFGRLFGLVCAFDDKPQSAPEDTLALLEWLTPRLGREAGVLRTQRNILNSVRWMATSSSEQVFTHAVAHLCEVLQVTTAFLIENSDEDPSSGVVRALLHRGNRLVDYEGTRVEYSGRPFAQLSSEDRVCIPEGLPERYPGWGMVHRLGVQSLIVYGMRHPNGQPIGSLGVGHTRTLEPGVIESPVFSLYIARVAAELARLRDERERLEMERVLSVKHKMESLGLMAGHIAHDFNNLLMAILGNANLASEVLDAASPARRFIDNIESASLAAGEIVGQLLDYAGRKPSKPMLVEVSELVSSASALVELSHYPSARVVYELQPDLPRVETDPSQLQQVIVNLVLNAAEALGGKPGRIRIRTDLVTLQARQIGRLIQGRDLHPGRYVCISVTDDGVGIEEAALNRIFDPFFTSKKEGRGLGLSAVRGYVESSGGGLAISSRVGAGTSVRLYLQPV